MKALILAGGRGKRLGELTDSKNKCMLEFGGRPALEHNIERAASIDEINEIIIVVGFKADEIINKYGTSYKGKKIRYVIQEEQKGLVHAIECSKSAIGNDDFFLLLGDEVLINSRQKEMMKEFKEKGLFATCGMMKQKDRSKIAGPMLLSRTTITGSSGWWRSRRGR